jgi:hypothetical protein
MNGYIAGTVIGAIVIGLSAVSLEAIFAGYAKIERSTLSAVVCPLIAYMLVGVFDGFMSDGDFVAAYFHYLPGLGVILLMMLKMRRTLPVSTCKNRREPTAKFQSNSLFEPTCPVRAEMIARLPETWMGSKHPFQQVGKIDFKSS